MLILGLGSNLIDSVNNLRRAVQLLQKSHAVTVVKISPVYSSSALLPAYAPLAWDKPYLNLALRCQSSLTPTELLAAVKQVEKQLGRQESQRWAPRIIDIDILAWGDYQTNQAMLQIPHPELEKRPFALWPLLDLLPEWQHPQRDLSDLLGRWGSRFSGQAPFNTRQLPHRLLGTQLVGILNVTPDSFSDGGQFLELPEALAQAEKLVLEGAEILDIGAESTRPGAKPVSPEDEWCRLAPILSVLKDSSVRWPIKPKLSIDTRHYQVAEKALELGIDWINDVSGFADSRMGELAVKNAVKCVVMHNLGVPADKNKVLSSDPNICQQIFEWAKQRFKQLIAAGVAPEQLIFDIGIGFGKTAQQSASLLKNINYFRGLDCQLLVGHSRKSFLNLVTDKLGVERDIETALLSYQLAAHHVDYLRVHNVELNARAVNMAAQWMKESII
ncbi:2-amino-4-hydroxy-6-hydroxymethyldihydropteridine pyrophosphokinase [Candidatus Rickettsiella viridis]|uniref:2-amino-4-hydroxy-6-hydroxymethyldihydropteridine pyrophosphokinase n=1 Tax=Candidatus Rickettsiella viridis TaxID=676208 RepID=A0A2Z5UVA0_9COXI|nr:dihydropteroate synthase [Candidatus Rickettsiella viridis]BBB14883.1 2-amino-4-hydroxy-6-hydroxymethyldihydropteridine pyrophosphokinase [Candidatus Rickettsiella viridis]